MSSGDAALNEEVAVAVSVREIDAALNLEARAVEAGASLGRHPARSPPRSLDSAPHHSSTLAPRTCSFPPPSLTNSFHPSDHRHLCACRTRDGMA